MYIIKAGLTDVSIYIHLRDSATGLAETGLAYNSAGASAYYTRPRGTATAITLATLAAADSAHSDGGFKEIDATNAKGLYRLDLPDAAVAAGADYVIVSVEFDGVIEESLLINLSPDVNVASVDNNAITAAAIADDAIDAAAFADDAITADVVAAGAIASGAIAIAELNNIADALLKRDWTGLTGEAARSMLNALRFLRNKWSVSGTTLTITKEDDSTSAWTATITSAAGADPITGSDPS